MHVYLFFLLTPLTIFATKSLGFPDPPAPFGGVVWAEEDPDLRNIWFRRRYVATATTPTPMKTASVDTAGIMSERFTGSLVGGRGREGGTGRRPNEGGGEKGKCGRQPLPVV